MLIHMRKLTVYERPKLKVRLGPNVIEMVRQYRVLGLIINERCEGTNRQETGATIDTTRQEPIHNKGVKLGLRVFAICKTEHALREASFPTLAEMRELNTTIVSTRIFMNVQH
jgi:hypothetical protein